MSDKAVCVMAFSSGMKPQELVNVIRQSADMMDPNASLWLWVKGRYDCGSLSWDHWKVASELCADGWQVRNEIAYSCKVSDPAPENRLKRSYEKILHITRGWGYYYDRTMGIGVSGMVPRNKNGSVVTKSGVVGKKYASQIESSPFLDDNEKAVAMNALKEAVAMMSKGEISDFRMVLRGVHKITRSVAEKVIRDGFHIRATTKHSQLVDDLWTSFSSDTNSLVPKGVILGALRLSCPMGGMALDLFPSDEVSKIVMSAGRRYTAREVNGYNTPVQERELFDIEETDNDQKEICEQVHISHAETNA